MSPLLNRNFHIPLPIDLYEALRAEATRRRRPATELAREVLEQWRERVQAEALHSEIAAYASSHAGTSIDLDPELESAGIEAWTGVRSVKAQRPRKARK